MNKLLATSVVAAFSFLGFSARDAHAQPARGAGTYVCDIAYEDCREDVLMLIRNETVGIDLSFWFMTDARYSNEIVRRWNAGVPVRIIMDPRANTSKPANATQLTQLQQAGIPMLNKPFGDIAHWKGMIFAGQNVAEFSGANYSPYEYVYEIPYVQYQDEAIYVSSEPDVVQGLMRRFDDVWTNSVYTFYANPIARVRSYPESYTIAPEFNLPPDDSYTARLLPLLDAETQAIDVVMFRITDPRPADALIRAVERGVPVRLYAEPLEYRNPARAEDSYNIDRMYMGGVHIKMRAHAGQNHQKTVRLAGQHTTIFGTSNWSTASDDNQLEVNYFTTKDWFYQFFADQFEWKWNNQPRDGSETVQTTDFVPLPPDPPSYTAPSNMATGVNPDSVTLEWYAGNWARKYDLYLGVGSNPPLYMADVQLGPSRSTSDYKSLAVTGLLPGTLYSWKIVSKTMANIAAEGPLWSFTTSGTPPPDPPGSPPDTTAPSVVLSSPANGASVAGTIQISASAADNVAVAGVQFKLDGVSLGAEDRSGPFTMSWDTTSVAGGAHTLTAEARDAAGNAATSPTVTVTVSNGGTPPPDTTAPTVSVTAPAAGSTLSGATTVSASGFDNIAIAGVQFKLDDVNLAEDTTAPYSVSWNTASASNGTHTLTAQARDGAGNTAVSSPVSVMVSNTPPPPAPPAGTIVLRAGNVPADSMFGNWIKSSDNTAADGVAIWNVDSGMSKIAPAPVAPEHYVDMTFNAQANVALHHLWVRMRAENDYFGNDSIHVQFSDAIDAANAPIYRIGSSGVGNSAQVVLQETDSGPISGWGWADQGWNGLGPHVYFATSGPHTLRIGQREDGTIIDQIVLSSDTYLTTPPGSQNHDTTILPVSAAPPVPPADTTPPSVVVSAPAGGLTVSGTTTISADSSDDTGVAGVQFSVDGMNVGAEDTTFPYSVSWETTSAANGTHTVTALARDAAGNTAVSAAVSVTVSNVVAPPPDSTPPAVSVTAPSSDATVSGGATISASASDNAGIAGVQFKLDGVNLGSEDTTAPYSVPWDTTLTADGTHTLTAQARDDAGNTAVSAAVSVTVSNAVTPPAPAGTIVIRAADVPAESMFGNWIKSMDNSAADGVALWNTDNGAGKIVPAPIAPQHYVDIAFNALPNTAYHLWIRMRAQNDYFGNDSIHVQFSDAVDAANAPIYRIGSSGTDSSAQVVLQETDGGLISGWGWADQGWNGLGRHIYFETPGPHTLRIEQREDGTIIDQIVLSPNTYLTTAPGAQNHDQTIVPR